MTWGAKGTNLYINDLDLKRLKNTVINRKSAFNIVEWWFLKELLKLEENEQYKKRID